MKKHNGFVAVATSLLLASSLFAATPVPVKPAPGKPTPDFKAAKGQDPENAGKTCNEVRADKSVHRGKCEDVCRDKEVTIDYGGREVPAGERKC